MLTTFAAGVTPVGVFQNHGSVTVNLIVRDTKTNQRHAKRMKKFVAIQIGSGAIMESAYRNVGDVIMTSIVLTKATKSIVPCVTAPNQNSGRLSFFLSFFRKDSPIIFLSNIPYNFLSKSTQVLERPMHPGTL